MKSRSKELIDKAIASTISAIEIYNKPDFQYRAETFCILAINGWELLFKAKWLREHNNKIDSLYVKDEEKESSKSKKPKTKRTRSGNPVTHSIYYLGTKLREQKHLEQNAWTNIQALLELRNTSIHFYNSSPNFTNEIQEIGAASLHNFVSLVQEWFDRDLSKFNFYLMPLSFVKPPMETKAIVLNKEENNCLKYLEQLRTQASENDDKYFVALSMEVKIKRSKSKDAVGVRRVPPTNTDALPVRMTEEQVLEQYPWEYKKLVAKCRERYSDFKLNKEFHGIKRTICEQKQETVCKTRYLNPRNPKSGKKQFYKQEILQEFDKHYTKIEK